MAYVLEHMNVCVCVCVCMRVCVVLTAALFPGKLKKESGPFLWAMLFSTDSSFTACGGWGGHNTHTHTGG